jgi:DNA-binding transcriptional regulator YhcF (GntR family)
MVKMQDKLLTQRDLAERWQVSEQTIRNWRQEGIIQTVKGLPAPRFSMQHILELEGVKLEKFSPLLKKQMEKEIEKLKEENLKLKKIISNVLAETSQVIGM